jgi:phenylacetate-CoA ligase
MGVFQPEAETMNRRDLLDLQNERLGILINHAYANVRFYRNQFDAVGLNPDDIKTLEDLKKIPFTTREDLVNNYPYGMFAVPLRDVVRLQFPLSHYGNPIVIGYTREDLKIWRELVARIMFGVGITEHDIIQVAFNYGLFMGAFRFNQGAELIGAAVVPASVAPADVQIRIMRDFKSTVLVSTPSFALHIIETMKKQGIDPRDLSLKIGLFGAEPWPESARDLIEAGLGIKAFDIYGVTELIEPGVSGECTAISGLHIFEDHFFPEIIDPVTGQSLEEGQEGELVLTSLTTTAYPLIRYRTHDRTALCTAPCDCGRTLVRMNRIFHRTDQMISIRGINVFPETIADVLRNFEGIGPAYSLDIKQKYGMNDKLNVFIETSPELLCTAGNVAAFHEKVRTALRKALGLRVELEMVQKEHESKQMRSTRTRINS